MAPATEPPVKQAKKGDEAKPAEGKEAGDKKKKVEEPEITEEDKQLMEELNLLVERLKESDQKLYPAALEALRTHIRSATTSMTSVPKPLKFLRPHYDSLKEVHSKIKDAATKRSCADIVSCLAMTREGRDCLNYRLLSMDEDVGRWGHEYVRHLSAEIVGEWSESPDEAKTVQLLKLVDQIVPYLMTHNAETEGVDLLMEIESYDTPIQLDRLLEFVDESTYGRVCLYLNSCVPFVPEGENTLLIKTALKIFQKFDQQTDALRLALALNDLDTIKKIFYDCKDSLVRRQMAFMLSRQQVFLDAPEGDDEIADLLNNSYLSSYFLGLGRELDIMEPKDYEDVYKKHLEASRFGGGSVDSARQSLANSFVNSFVNCAFGKDNYLTNEDQNKGKIFLTKNKDHGLFSAMASLGLVLLWDVDGGLSYIDKYLYSTDDYIKGGGLLACGIVSSGVRHDCDPALALLCDYTLHQSMMLRLGSVVGLGLGYAAANREDVIQLLIPVLTDNRSTNEVIGMTALSLGLVALGSMNGEVNEALTMCLMARTETQARDPYCKMIGLALGLIYLQRQDETEPVLQFLDQCPEPIRGFTKLMVEICAYAGTGNVLQIQKLMHICSEHEPELTKEELEKEKKSKKTEEKKTTTLATQQGLAVLGISLIAMGEDTGVEMALRNFGQLLRYGDPAVRRAVPLALALLSVSNPKLPILDTLSKFSHDADAEVAHNSIFSLGIVGAGTNNARLAAMLRQLAAYHSKDPANLFMVRLAQGLTHLGKGTLTLSPFHSDRSLMMPVAVAGLLSVLVSCLDVKTTILGKSHYILYHLVLATQPRMLQTFDEKLEPLPVTVRVGQAVDVVGIAGKPKTITGFQTHTTPVLLGYGERAELATDEFSPVSNVLEGFVILKKNPNYQG